MFRFRYIYFVAAITIFLIEVLIALFVHDTIVRPYIGDLLVVILIYCFLCSFLNFSVLSIAIFTLLFSYLVEAFQYINLIEKIGLQNSKLARVIIGTSFSWVDIFSYTLGIILVLLIEKIMLKKKITERT